MPSTVPESASACAFLCCRSISRSHASKDPTRARLRPGSEAEESSNEANMAPIVATMAAK
eukprot:7798521-Lingulodinium_polyedra.AAC.1